MIALYFLVISLIASLGIVHRVAPKFPLPLAYSFAAIISVITSTWLSIGLIGLVGYRSGIMALLIICSVVALKLLPGKKFLLFPYFSKGFLIFITIWLVLFLYLFDIAFLKPTAEGLSTVLYTYGDVALHSTYITHFAEQNTFSLRSPIFIQEIFSYPFFINFHSSLLVRLGLSVREALITSSVLLISAALSSLYYFTFNITRKTITPYLAAVLLFLNGGVGWTQLFSDFSNSQTDLFSFISQLPFDYAHIKEQGYFWSNNITTHLLPQRGFLVGFSTLLVILSTWQWVWYQKKAANSLLLLVSVVIGLLPLFHTHSYLVLGPLLIWYMGWLYQSKRIILSQVLLLIAPACLIGVIQLYMLSSGKSLVSWQLWWMAPEGEFISFWWKNMGLYLLLIPVATWQFVLRYSEKTFEKLLIFPSLAIIVLCNIFIFQPNDWDNMKFFMLSHTVLAVIIAAVFSHFWKDIWSRIGISLLVILTCVSGLLSVVYISQNQVIIASSENVKISKEVKRTPGDSVFLTADSHNHPVPMLSGRAIVMGYRGWLWTHAVEYSQTQQEVAAMYYGFNSQRLFNKYGINYVYIGPQERRQYQVNEKFFQDNYPLYYQEGSTSIYQITN